MSMVGFSLGNSFYQVAVFEHGRARLVLQTKPCDVVKLVNLTEDVLGTELGSVVIAVPTFFTYSQCRKIEDDCTAVGLHVLRVIKDTTAASVAHGFSSLDRLSSGSELSFLLVYQQQHDVGVSVANASSGGVQMVSKVGGHPWQDRHLLEKVVITLAEDFQRRFGKCLLGNPEALGKLQTAAMDMMSQLSSEWFATVTLPELHEGVDYAAAITKSEMENLNRQAFLQSMVQYIQSCVGSEAGTSSQIQQLVLLEGFDAHALEVLQREVFGGRLPEVKFIREEAAAIGAALQAATLNGKLEYLLADVTTSDLRIELAQWQSEVVLPRNTTFPTTKTFFCDPQSCAFPVRLLEGNDRTASSNEFVMSLEIPNVAENMAVLNIDENGYVFLHAAKSELAGSA